MPHCPPQVGVTREPGHLRFDTSLLPKLIRSRTADHADHPGIAVLANTDIAAQGWIREGITLSMSNSDQDNFERGLVSIRAEERLMVGVVRPNAINIITGL